MRCAWQSYINLLPIWIRDVVDKRESSDLEEVRLRLNSPPELKLHNDSIWLSQNAGKEDLQYVINAATQYSPWTSHTISEAYITASGGHRIGLCGHAVMPDKYIKSFRSVNSVCVRLARDYPGIASNVRDITGSILIIGEPGSGKTTLLRDLIRQRSDYGKGYVAVVDERCEIFPLLNGESCFFTGKRTDVISGCNKSTGIGAMLKNMRPETIAVDEITDVEDCISLLNASWCGVNLIATAHAGNVSDLMLRPAYKPLLDNHIFQTILVLKKDKTWHAERLSVCK